MEEIPVDGAIGQLERGENGTPHIQAIFYSKKKKSFKAW